MKILATLSFKDIQYGINWDMDIKIKTSLKYINKDSLKVGKCHHVWSTVRNSIYDRRRAQLKCRFVVIGSSVSVSCFGVRFSVMFHFMFVHYTFS